MMGHATMQHVREGTITRQVHANEFADEQAKKLSALHPCVKRFEQSYRARTTSLGWLTQFLGRLHAFVKFRGWSDVAPQVAVAAPGGAWEAGGVVQGLAGRCRGHRAKPDGGHVASEDVIQATTKVGWDCCDAVHGMERAFVGSEQFAERQDSHESQWHAQVGDFVLQSLTRDFSSERHHKKKTNFNVYRKSIFVQVEHLFLISNSSLSLDAFFLHFVLPMHRESLLKIAFNFTKPRPRTRLRPFVQNLRVPPPSTRRRWDSSPGETTLVAGRHPKPSETARVVSVWLRWAYSGRLRAPSSPKGRRLLPRAKPSPSPSPSSQVHVANLDGLICLSVGFCSSYLIFLYTHFMKFVWFLFFCSKRIIIHVDWDFIFR